MIVAKKIKMSRLFDEQGNTVPVTFLEVLPSKLQTKGDQTTIAVLAKVDTKKPQQKVLADFGFENGFVFDHAVINDFYGEDGQINPESLIAGREVQITGISKGKGFAGTVKRHNFSRGPKTHGSNNYRKPGSIGSGYPERVVKGRRMGGHMGVDQVTIHATIVDFDSVSNLLAIKGAIPGPRKSLVKVLTI